jgi:hypothetical protein
MKDSNQGPECGPAFQVKKCTTFELFSLRSAAVDGRSCSQFENNYFTEMCSGSEAGSYFRLIDFVFHSTLGLRAKKKRELDRQDQMLTPTSSSSSSSSLSLQVLEGPCAFS